MTDDDIRRALLKQRRLFGTQQAMAKAMGVSEQALYRFISGKQDCTHRTSKILAALGLETVMVRVTRPEIEL